MTGRDRIVVIAIAVVVLLGAAWLIAVSPERKKAAALGAQVTAASAQLATAEAQVANARSAQGKYAAAYTEIVNLGKAVPPSQEVPSLIYQIAHATDQKNVEFSSISTNGAGGASTSSAAASTPAAGASASATPSGFTQMPFTFVFNGSFSDLYHLFQQLDSSTVRTAAGGLSVSGRLLTVQSIKLSPSTTSSSGKGAGGGSEQLSGNVTATAYVLPASQGLTAGASTSAPAGTASTPAATPASTSASTSSPTAPALARVTP
jgi:hypothetical protein